MCGVFLARPLVMHMWRHWQSVRRRVSWRVIVKDGAHGASVGEDAAEIMMMLGVRGTEVQSFGRRLTQSMPVPGGLVCRLLCARPRVKHLRRHLLGQLTSRVTAKTCAWRPLRRCAARGCADCGMEISAVCCLLAVSSTGRSDFPFGRGFVGSHRRAANSRQPIVYRRRRASNPAYQVQAAVENDRQKDGRERSSQKGAREQNPNRKRTTQF
jgi:hypothetical protein